MFRSLVCCCCTMLLCSSSVARAGDKSACEDYEPIENAAWIVVGPDSVLFAKNREAAAKLAEDSKTARFAVACEEFQFHGQRADGQTGLQLECSNVVVIYTDNLADAEDFTVMIQGKTLKVNLQTLSVSVAGTDGQKVRIVSRQGETQTSKLEADSIRMFFDAAGHRLEATAAQVQLETRIAAKPEPPATAVAEPVEVLYFNAAWCGPCQKMNPVVSKLKGEGIPICVVNVDSDRPLVEKHQVTSIPQFLFFRNGVKVEQLSGVQSEETLKETLATVRQGKVKCAAETPDTCCTKKCCTEQACCPCAPKPTTYKVIRGAGQQVRLIEYSRPANPPESGNTPADTKEEPSQLFEALWPEVFNYKSSPSVSKEFFDISHHDLPVTNEDSKLYWPLLLNDTDHGKSPKNFRFGSVEFNR